MGHGEERLASPWDIFKPTPRCTGFEVCGNVDAILRSRLFRSEQELREATAMLTSGIPEDIPLRADWEQYGESCSLHVIQDDYELHHSFEYDESIKNYKAHWRIFSVPKALARATREKAAPRMARNAILLYHGMGVTRVDAYANFERGGYVWAKLGAAPIDSGVERRNLKDRLDDLAGMKNSWLTPMDIAQIAALIGSPNDLTLMHGLARLKTPSGRRIGRRFLLGHSWDARWDLENKKQQDMIIGGLTGDQSTN
jgi:hypothetical protein